MSNISKSSKSLFLVLSTFMGVVIIVSNYLVQFPINKFNLQNLLTYGALSYPYACVLNDPPRTCDRTGEGSQSRWPDRKTKSRRLVDAEGFDQKGGPHFQIRKHLPD